MTAPSPCGHVELVHGCGGCDPGAIEFVITDAGRMRAFDPTLDMTAPTVTDRTQADRLPTGHVTLTHVGDASDNELADIAGYCSRHFGYSVPRWADDDTATVHLFND